MDTVPRVCETQDDPGCEEPMDTANPWVDEPPTPCTQGMRDPGDDDEYGEPMGWTNPPTPQNSGSAGRPLLSSLILTSQ